MKYLAKIVVFLAFTTQVAVIEWLVYSNIGYEVVIVVGVGVSILCFLGAIFIGM